MKIPEILMKNKKYLIILIAGIILLLLGSGSNKQTVKNTDYNPNFIDEKKLVNTLEQIEGAGKVKVFISYKNDGKKQIAQKISNSDRGTEIVPEEVENDFYVLSVDTPEITGVLITASGATDKNVKERILRGAKHALGVPYHRISVELGK